MLCRRLYKIQRIDGGVFTLPELTFRCFSINNEDKSDKCFYTVNAIYPSAG